MRIGQNIAQHFGLQGPLRDHFVRPGQRRAGHPAQLIVANAVDAAGLERFVRQHSRGDDVLFHGTRYPLRILEDDALRASTSGTFGVSFSRSIAGATCFALLERPDDDSIGAIFALDRQRLRADYSVRPFRGSIQSNEMEELIEWRDVLSLNWYLRAVFLVGDGPAVAAALCSTTAITR